jgi:primosomal protein N' (replication factor Y)
MNCPAYAEIVLPMPVDRAYTYIVPEALRDRAEIGMRAVVPVKQQIATGFIVGLKDAAETLELRPLLDLPDESPVFSAELLELCRWVAEYYCCAWGEALLSALPAALKKGGELQYRLAEGALETGRLSDRQKKIVAALHAQGVCRRPQLAKAAGATALSNPLQALIRRGVVIAEPVVEDASVSMRTEMRVRIREDAVPDAEALAALQRRAPKQAAVYLDLLHGAPERAATELYDRHDTDLSVLRALEKRGLIETFEQEFYRAPDYAADARASAKHALNRDQQAALDALREKLDAGTFATFLLQGITGSGKTEVYLQAIEHALAQGRSALMLVPEISLTPQTVGRFFGRFRQEIAVLHSGLSRGERYDEWRRAQRGEVRIVVGARSAVFAPLPKLGIIIVDEEHDSSYKQNETPRYHARDTAILRAQRLGAVCVLGSATPSIEARFNAESGKAVLLELKQRATQAALPRVTLVDMRREARAATGPLALSEPLEAAITRCLSRGEQAILLLNRRGFAPYVLCPHCGWSAECTECLVSLTYHAVGAHLRCHYCGARHPKPDQCARCKSRGILFMGIGTQRAEELLLRSFPRARIERMDADTTAGKGGHAKILGRFAAGEIDVLIGTQMLAKGHDYPGVTLVGVINADQGLNVPDFRAAEQTFQLLTQVAGRAGRGDRPGEVYVQTYRPAHYAIAAAAAHDYAGFYAAEMEHRRGPGYPPYRRLANLLLEGEDALETERAALALRRLVCAKVEAFGFKGLEVLGPSPAAIRRIKKQYRWHLGLLSKSAQRLNVLCRAVREEFDGPPGTRLKIDLDPCGI